MLLILACNARFLVTRRAFHRCNSSSQIKEGREFSIGTVGAVLGPIFLGLGRELGLNLGGQEGSDGVDRDGSKTATQWE